MLIGNKCDLRMREVKSEDAGVYAEQQQMAFLETSALEGTNVNMAFECIIKGKCLHSAFNKTSFGYRNLQTKLDGN